MSEPEVDPLGFRAQAMLCDSAVAVEGKLYLQGGGWNVLHVPALPFAAPRIGIAVLLEIPYGATRSRHRLTVELIDEDGSRLSLGPQLGLSFEAGRADNLPPGEAQLLPIALNIDGYLFTRAGGYSFLAAVDTVEVTRLRFRVQVRAPRPRAA